MPRVREFVSVSGVRPATTYCGAVVSATSAEPPRDATDVCELASPSPTHTGFELQARDDVLDRVP